MGSTLLQKIIIKNKKSQQKIEIKQLSDHGMVGGELGGVKLGSLHL